MKLITILLLLATSAFSKTSNYYPQDVVDTFEESQLRDQELKDLIHEVLVEYHQKHPGQQDTLRCNSKNSDCYKQRSNSYKTAKKILFGNLHLERNQYGEYEVFDVYCRKTFNETSKNIGSIGPGKVPNHTVVNCEHTWPQSKFSSRFSSNLQKGDLHHLYPTDSKANSSRSSHDSGNVKNGKAPTSNCSASAYGDRTYEPPDQHKGNVARAMFYFSVRYKLPINSKMEKALKLWHDQDPVDSEEQKRNDQIYELQKNRNPFIDYPHLTDLIKNF